ncbi:DRAP deaminase [Sphaerosporella brunnea]|uniref:Pseudouridine synthase n=1 Tax=Sphaerosporella brunnea TaxID=1250544 RepID=A0A5J5F844_9PEZI|nr:DRAP deaminase [Sphaerosporella brunnea]
MDTLISELPGIEPPSPPPVPRSPKPHLHPKSRPHEVKRKQHQHNVTKFVNKPPNPLYYFEDGLRKVYPYYFTFNTFCKERWRGKSLLEIFSTEFRDRPVEYYAAAIAAGTVCVVATDKRTVLAGAPARAGLDTIVQNGDMISHTMHRHEPPVTDQPIGIVYEDDGIIAISKPAGVPVHPTGRYNYNSVTEIMKHERGPDFLPMPCNRLDRLTSGLMFIAKTRDAADAFMNQLKSRTIRKQYVARVNGKFPDGDVVCDQPILQISPKLGLNRVKANGKHAKTLFRRIHYNAQNDYSIVECHPYTGRTHQLRVHLQYLGHPITNDPIYCNRKVFGPSLGKGGEGDDEDIITRLNKMGKSEVAEAEAYHKEIVDEHQKRKAEKMTGELCKICDTPLYSDPGPHELGIYLHAKRYECADGAWAYETSLPDWALEDG